MLYQLSYEARSILLSSYTAMITLHFHLQPQYKYELFHINFTVKENSEKYRIKIKLQIWIVLWTSRSRITKFFLSFDFLQWGFATTTLKSTMVCRSRTVRWESSVDLWNPSASFLQAMLCSFDSFLISPKITRASNLPITLNVSGDKI